MTAILAAIQAQEPEYELPPEEDENLARTTEYSFNPLQADKELQVGNFYMKKGSYRAAAGRFQEAAKWNPRLAEAYFRLGEALEKQIQNEDGGQQLLALPKEIAEQMESSVDGDEKLSAIKQALEAYKKYLEIEPKGKHSRSARGKIAKLGGG